MSSQNTQLNERREVVTTANPQPPEPNDGQLVELVLAGAPGAVDRFVDRFTKFVYSVFHRDLGLSAEDADDLHNETFMRLIDDDCRRLRLWSGEGNFVNWLGPICRNLANDQYFRRKKTRREVPLDGSDDVDDLPPLVPICTDPGPEEVAEAAELRRIVHQAVDRLPERDGTFIRLRHFEEKSYREISELTGYKISGVGVILTRAEKRLKNEVDRLLDERRNGPDDG